MPKGTFIFSAKNLTKLNKDTDSEINSLVYELYELTAEEIAAVENS